MIDRNSTLMPATLLYVLSRLRVGLKRALRGALTWQMWESRGRSVDRLPVHLSVVVDSRAQPGELATPFLIAPITCGRSSMIWLATSRR